MNDSEIREYNEKIITHFIDLPIDTKTSVFKLLRNTLSKKEFDKIELEDFWIIFELFVSECKNRKIGLLIEPCYRIEMGFPYEQEIIRVKYPLVKRVTFHYHNECCNECYEIQSQVRDRSISFNRERVSLITKPYNSRTSKENCYINVSYNPYEEDNFTDYSLYQIGTVAESIINNHKIKRRLLDEESYSISILYSNGNRRKARNLYKEDIPNLFYDYLEKYAPKVRIEKEEVKERHY